MRLAITLVAAMLVACGQSDKPHKATSAEKKTPTVEELVADPEQLKKLRQQCKTDRPTLGELLCNRVAEATRKRFYGDGKRHTHRPKNPPNSEIQQFSNSAIQQFSNSAIQQFASLPESSVRHADIRRRLRSHSLARHSANSFFLIDLSAPNGL
jgi:hypothetical protein